MAIAKALFTSKGLEVKEKLQYRINGGKTTKRNVVLRINVIVIRINKKDLKTLSDEFPVETPSEARKKLIVGKNELFPDCSGAVKS